jgi:phosphate/sulfate permease
MVKKYGDIYSSVFLLLFSVVYFIATFYLREMTVSAIGSEFVPRLVAIGIFILSVALLLKSIKQLKLQKYEEVKEQQEQSNQEVKSNESSMTKALNVIATIGLIAVYIFLMPMIGFIITTILYLFIQFVLLAPKSQRNYLLFITLAIVVSVSVYYVFKFVLHLMLPAGILG